MELTITDFQKLYIDPAIKTKRHIFYDETVKSYHQIKVHADGEKPGALLTERRPSESEKIQLYREKIFVPITKSDFTKVYNSLMKIRKSQDWSIKHPKNNPLIREDESLQNYLDFRFPKYTSLTNWYFQIGLRNQLVDVNAKVFIKPIDFVVPDNEYIKPYPLIFNSDDVLDYETEKYYVFKSKEKITYTEQGQKYFNGQRYYVVTDTNIQVFDQITNDKKYSLTINYLHGLGFVPVYDFKGIVIEEDFLQTFYESKIQSMIPYLDEAIREYSDMQAEVVQHVHSTLWAQQGHDCRKCKGSGVLIGKKNNVKIETDCNACHGKGFYPFNPYENYVTTKPEAGASPQPSPPAGYIEKNTAIVTIQNSRIEGHKYNAYAAINFEFLAQTPLNTSGVSKAYDRDEANNFVHGIAEDGVELLDNICYCINEYRNKKAVKDQKRRDELLPTINVPEKYDLVSDSYLLDDLSKMKTSKIDSSIVTAAEIDYAKKRFNTDPKIASMLSLKLSLDPFGGDSDDTITAKLFRDTIEKINVIIHDNIASFIERAFEENKEFAEIDKIKQMEILMGYAGETQKVIEGDANEIVEPVIIPEPVI